jgi:hypothetical protein
MLMNGKRTLCVADCTRHGPTLKGGEWAAVGKVDDADDVDPGGAGVDDLLLPNEMPPLDAML